MIDFDAPAWLSLLAILPVFWLLRRRRAKRAMPVPSLQGLADLPFRRWERVRWVVPMLRAAALALMIVALAGPRGMAARGAQPREGRSVVLAVDVSETMGALDFLARGGRVSRLEGVKAAARELLVRRAGDRVGLVVCGTEAYTGAPLTTDHRAVGDQIDRLAVGGAGLSTALGDALALGARRLLGTPPGTRAIVLFSDGSSNAGAIDPGTAAVAAAELGVRVHTVGVGRGGEAPFLVEDPLGGREVVQRRADVDEAALRAIAAATGGEYFRAEDGEALRRASAAIERLEMSASKSVAPPEGPALYPLVLFGSLICLLLALVGEAGRCLEIP